MWHLPSPDWRQADALSLIVGSHFDIELPDPVAPFDRRNIGR